MQKNVDVQASGFTNKNTQDLKKIERNIYNILCSNNPKYH